MESSNDITLNMPPPRGWRCSYCLVDFAYNSSLRNHRLEVHDGKSPHPATMWRTTRRLDENLHNMDVH